MFKSIENHKFKFDTTDPSAYGKQIKQLVGRIEDNSVLRLLKQEVVRVNST